MLKIVSIIILASLNCTCYIFNDQGPTHRLEINPVGVDPSSSTVLRVSDLNSEEGSTDVIVEQESSNYTNKLNSLHAEVEHLRTEVNYCWVTEILQILWMVDL